MITAAYITASQFSCNSKESTHVIYRARLSSTPSVSSTHLIDFLQEWVITGSASVTLEHIRLNVDSTCNVAISSLDDSICPASTPTSEIPNITANVKESSSNTSLIIALLVLVGLMMLVVVVGVCAFLLYQIIPLRSVVFLFCFLFVCLFVCLFVSLIAQNISLIAMYHFLHMQKESST